MRLSMIVGLISTESSIRLRVITGEVLGRRLGTDHQPEVWGVVVNSEYTPPSITITVLPEIRVVDWAW